MSDEPKRDVIAELSSALDEAKAATAAQHQLSADTAAALERFRVMHRAALNDLLATLLDFGARVAVGDLRAEDFAPPIASLRRLIESIL